MTSFLRSYPLEDLTVRSGGDGRTVEAFTAVFDVESEIRDVHGEYREVNDRTAFNKTVADNGTRFGVFYNHARNLHGEPSDTFSLPVGVPVEPPRVETLTVDGRSITGLLTVTRYSKTDLADTVLEGIRAGAIRGYSYSGRFIRSTPDKPRGGYRADRSGVLPLVRRVEIAMKEYGPTPFPAFDDAAVVGVRSLAAQLADLTDDERAEIAAMLTRATPLDGVPDADAGTPDVGAAAVEEPQTHSGRLTASQRARIGLITRGMGQ